MTSASRLSILATHKLERDNAVAHSGTEQLLSEGHSARGDNKDMVSRLQFDFLNINTAPPMQVLTSPGTIRIYLDHDSTITSCQIGAAAMERDKTCVQIMRLIRSSG